MLSARSSQSWAAATGLASLPDKHLGGKGQVAAMKTEILSPANRPGSGGSLRDRQPLGGSQVYGGGVLPEGCQEILVPGLGWAAAGASPGQMLIQAPGAGVGRTAGCGWVGEGRREHWLLSTAGICPAGLWCLLLCQFLVRPTGLLRVSSPVSSKASECALTVLLSAPWHASRPGPLRTTSCSSCFQDLWGRHCLFLCWPRRKFVTGLWLLWDHRLAAHSRIPLLCLRVGGARPTPGEAWACTRHPFQHGRFG